MKVFNNLEEMRPYYNAKTNTYEFIENGEVIDVEFAFNVDIPSHIKARDIDAWDIKARDIKARDIDAWDINARDIDAWDIKAEDIDAEDIDARDIDARDIDARDIDAEDIDARDIDAEDINAQDINAQDINARDIDARNISYYAVCFAYNGFSCKSVKGRRKNAKHFCLDSEILYKNEEQTQ